MRLHRLQTSGHSGVRVSRQGASLLGETQLEQILGCISVRKICEHAFWPVPGIAARLSAKFAKFDGAARRCTSRMCHDAVTPCPEVWTLDGPPVIRMIAGSATGLLSFSPGLALDPSTSELFVYNSDLKTAQV